MNCRRLGLCLLLVLAGIIGQGLFGSSASGQVGSVTVALPIAPAPNLGTRKIGDDWPGFLGPWGNSTSRETGLVTPWPKDGPRIVWQVPLGQGYGPPSISQGRLLHFDRYGDQARVTCRNSETGVELWKFEYTTDYEDQYGYSNGPRCCPVIDGPLAYIFGAEGMLHCLQVANGKLVWKFDTQKQFGVIQNFFGVGSAPAVFGDLLIVQVGGSPAGSDQLPFESIRGNGSNIVAFDKRTGAVKYQFGNQLASYASPLITDVAGKKWGFQFARGGLVGFDPVAGKEEFFFPWRARILESVNAANPVVVGDEVLITECYGVGSALLKFKPGGSEVVWQDTERSRDKILRGHWCTPVYHNGFVYACSGRHTNEGDLRAIDWKTGKVAWSEPGQTRCSILLVDGHLIVLGEYGNLQLLKANPERFEKLSEVVLRKTEGFALPGVGLPSLLEYPAWAAPVLSHGLLYVRGKDALVCVEVMAPPK